MQKNWTLTREERSVSEDFSLLSSVGLVLTLMKRIMMQRVEVKFPGADTETRETI